MKISLRGEYAVRALTLLGERYGTEVIRIQDVASKENIPRRFLEQILNDLKTAGFVESRRGVSGGYRLARSPDQISLGEIVRHLEGDIGPVACANDTLQKHCSCPDAACCPLRLVMREVRASMVKIFENTSIADLVARAAQVRERSRHEPDYVI